MKLGDFNADAIRKLLTDLQVEATGFVRSCDAAADILSVFKVYMRYSGQGWEIPIKLSHDQAMDPDAATFKARFEEDYAKLFGRTVSGMDIEITVWSVNATTPKESVARIEPTIGADRAHSQVQRSLFDAAAGQYLEADVIDRMTLQTGQRVHGPAAVVEDETTIIIPSSRDAIRQPDGCIDVVIRG
ncbi:hypothetical protein ROLI_037780 [Roseobacter fucihabitans]|uniref:Acetophenone carboxylase-like C-terminal domain-containing protein n=1 Tax=Roseobacter fucihabitans TaxID=1537242 RepID=A0ABZ2C1C5_9RHOB|nr:hypothetical protein [Roseobacter litoralis]MBC6967809.1 hypothetical protein [Roseobacter litoralis]